MRVTFYQTLDPIRSDGWLVLGLFARRELREAAEERRVRPEDDNDDE